MDDAKKKCPDLQLVHVATYAEGAEQAEYNIDPRPETHKVSLDPYRRESRKVVAIFNEMCPLGAVEKASIDEMYCDLTLAVRQLILQRYPELARPPADSPAGLDTPLPPPPEIDWTDLGNRLPTSLPDEAPQESPTSAQSGADGASSTSSKAPVQGLDSAANGGNAGERIREPAASWTDFALACGAEIILKVRQQVRERLGYTMSAGVAPNKTMAKLCASERKPNGQTTMLPAAIPIYLKDLPFQKIRFLGGKLGSAMASEWESSTVGDLWSVTLLEMQQKFGDESRWIYDVLRGIDYSPVIERTKNKTMLASKNVKPPIRSSAEAKRWLGILSLELCVRLKEARDESPNLWPSTLVLRYLIPGQTARSRQASFPFVKDLKADHVMSSAQKLWNESIGERIDFEVIVLALGFSGLESGEQGQRSLEGFFAGGASRPPQGQQATSVPAAEPTTRPPFKRQTSGSDEKARKDAAGSPVVGTEGPKAKKVKKSGLYAHLERQKVASSGKVASPVDGGDGDPGSHGNATSGGQTGAEVNSKQATNLSVEDGILPEADDSKQGPSWTCPRCGEAIHPRPRAPDHDATTTSADGNKDGSDADQRLQLAKQDHEDYHFARDLEQADKEVFMPRGSLAPSQKPSQSGGVAPSSSQRGGSSQKKGKGKGGAGAGLQNFFKRQSGGAS